MRWVLVPVSALGVWYAAVVSGIGGMAALDAFCRPEEMVSGLCTAPWHSVAVDILVIVMAAIAAFGIVVVPAAVAPGHRWTVAVCAFACGALFAIWFALGGHATGPFAGAAVGGMAGLARARRRHGAAAS